MVRSVLPWRPPVVRGPSSRGPVASWRPGVLPWWPFIPASCPAEHISEMRYSPKSPWRRAGRCPATLPRPPSRCAQNSRGTVTGAYVSGHSHIECDAQSMTYRTCVPRCGIGWHAPCLPARNAPTIWQGIRLCCRKTTLLYSYNRSNRGPRASRAVLQKSCQPKYPRTALGNMHQIGARTADCAPTVCRVAMCLFLGAFCGPRDCARVWRMGAGGAAAHGFFAAPAQILQKKFWARNEVVGGGVLRGP